MPPRIMVEDWIRVKCSLARLKKVQRCLTEYGLYPQDRLFTFEGGYPPLTEGVYRIHHPSFKVQNLDWIAKSSVQAIAMLVFGDTAPKRSERLFRKAIADDKLISHYYNEIDRLSGELKPRADGYIDTKQLSLPLLGAAVFWYVTMLALITVAEKALKNKRWRPRRYDWDYAIAAYVASYLANKRERIRYAADPEVARQVEKIMESLKLY